MKRSWFYIFVIGLLITSCQKDVDLDTVRLQECTAMPTPVASGTCFTYGESVYVFGGRDNSGTYQNTIWTYNTISHTWSESETTPLKERVSASSCVVGDCAYIGLGFAGKVQHNDSYLRDFWQYNLLTREWKRLADFPANTTVKNCLFATDTAIYAVYGFYRTFTQDVYRYDIQRDTWEKLHVVAPMSVPRAMDVVGATCSGKHFLGTGFNHGSLRFWTEWHPEQQSFTSRKKILGAGRNATACCATDKYIYLAGGRHYGDTLTCGFFYNSVQRYSPASNEWEYIGNMPYEAENMIMAHVNGQIFIGLGETKEGVIQDNWYRFEE